MKPKDPNSNIQKCVAAVRQYGTPEQPVSCMDIASVLELHVNIVQSRLATSIRKERHMHRKSVRMTPASRKSYIYWWDERKLNPDFGLRVLEKTRGGLAVDRITNTVILNEPKVPSLQEVRAGKGFFWADEPKPAPVPKAAPPITIGAGTTLTFKAGVVSVTPAELRTLYGQLKEFFA